MCGVFYIADWLRSRLLVALAIALPAAAIAEMRPLPHPTSPDIEIARKLHSLHPELSPSNVAAQVMIGEKYKAMIAWMREDLAQYLGNFDAIFEAKLERIRRHERQRLEDLVIHTAGVHDPAELERLTELHKPHGFVAQYADAEDFARKFIGPQRKLLKSASTADDILKMNQPGTKDLYVDTWAVPFFNTGTQTRAEAREGVRNALEVFRSTALNSEISMLRFSQLMALFARPEFDDVRRYKLIPFPTAQDIARFGAERSDARTFGEKYPREAMVVINRPIDLGPVSYIFGQYHHILGLISHSLVDNTADGRIFTGPADFLEHDFAHAFFNLYPTIPGTPEEWAKIHWEFIRMKDRVQGLRLKRMMRLVYYHFTHESGFRVLAEGGFAGELNIIRELLRTRYHYDFILKDGLYLPAGYDRQLNLAFSKVGGFFRDHFLRIYHATANGCRGQVVSYKDLIDYQPAVKEFQ